MRSISLPASLVVEAAGGAQDAVDHLGVDAVAIEVLDAQMRIGDAADVLGAVVVEAGLGHDVDAAVLALLTYLLPAGPTPFLKPNDAAVLAPSISGRRRCR